MPSLSSPFYASSAQKSPTNSSPQEKLAQLEKLLDGLGGVLIAYSGGVDSTFLAAVAHRVLGEKMLAVTASSPTYPGEEVEAAQNLAHQLNFPHLLISTQEMEDPAFIANNPHRCYYCKRELFHQLLDIAAQRGLPWVADGSNVDDLEDYRPGRRAIQELGVVSPLCQVGLTKAEIRALSQEMNLPTWDKPSLACLASRIPYGTLITPELLERIERAESYLHSLGISQVRVRHHAELARIEVDPESIPLLLQGDRPQEIARRLRELGYTYVTLDLLGYRTGSMNETLKGKQ